MRFWDASALVPLIVEEPRTVEAESQYVSDPQMVVWWATPVECLSAVARLRRDGVIDDHAEEEARSSLTTLADYWREIPPTAQLREQAIRLLRFHPLKAADSLQLAAALEWAGKSPSAGVFLTLDDRLRKAARKEGFATAV